MVNQLPWDLHKGNISFKKYYEDLVKWQLKCEGALLNWLYGLNGETGRKLVGDVHNVMYKKEMETFWTGNIVTTSMLHHASVSYSWTIIQIITYFLILTLVKT